jgi:hypothetical protein
MNLKILVVLLVWFVGNCSTITYKVVRKQNMYNTEIYREVKDRNHFFLFGFFPFTRNAFTYKVCKNSSAHTWNMEKKGGDLESSPMLVQTKYSALFSPLNSLVFPLYTVRNVSVYCLYD